ncbi:MAG: cation transporter [Thermoplasmata archaeon]|nr:cation transporter [Thermoplasmata archaeon]MBE3135813.1 cation transporter [Thermoplasmata archaeon]MBE3139081.1 cation transporter [Thermoplasmata archaeon]
MVGDRESVVNRTETIAAVTTVSLVGLGILQIILGETISRSVALTANGIDCIGDGFVSGIVWAGLRFFKRPADQRFHFGYYKIENLASIAATIVMFLLAGYIILRSYYQLVNPEVVHLPLIGAIVAFIAAMFAMGLGVYKIIKSRHTNMSSVKLDAFNTIKDGTTSFLTVVALLLSSFGYTIADPLIGFIIAGIILTIGFAAIKEAGYMLVDACDGDCLMYGLLIKTYAERVKGVQAAQVVRLRRTGPVIQGELEITVPGEMSVLELNKIQTEIIRVSSEKISELERLTITAVPLEK